MVIRLKQNDMSFWLICMLTMSVLSHAIHNVFLLGPSNLSYYVGYIAWMILALPILKQNMTLEKQWLGVIVLLSFSEAIGITLAASAGMSTLFDFHQWLFFTMCLTLTLGICNKIKIEERQIDCVMKSIVLLGLAASFYAISAQSSHMVAVLSNSSVSINAWQYISFFSQRNIFAAFCFLCSIPTLYLFLRTRQIRYLLAIGVLILQIYITNSRNSLVAILLFIALVVYLKTKRKTALVFCGVLLLVFGVSLFPSQILSVVDKYIHIDSLTGEDSFFTRLKMWGQGVEYLFQHGALITGLGFGASNRFLARQYAFGSFHNAFMELLFDGGVITLSAYLYAIKKLFQKFHYISNNNLRIVLTAGLIAHCVYSLFESGSMLFTVRDQSLLCTILFGILSSTASTKQSYHINSIRPVDKEKYQ